MRANYCAHTSCTTPFLPSQQFKPSLNVIWLAYKTNTFITLSGSEWCAINIFILICFHSSLTACFFLSHPNKFAFSVESALTLYSLNAKHNFWTAMACTYTIPITISVLITFFSDPAVHTPLDPFDTKEFTALMFFQVRVIYRMLSMSS